MPIWKKTAKVSQVDPDDVEVGSIIVVKPGERVPLDGIVIEGESMVDTSSLTGESVPRRVAKDSEIISGCVNGSGLLRVKTTKEFDDSTVTRILELVENASSKKAKAEKLYYKVCKILYAGRCNRCAASGSDSADNLWWKFL